MQSGNAAHTATGRSRLHPARWAGWGLGAFVLLVSAADLCAQALPAGTQIPNTAQVSWLDENGLAYSAGSNTVVLTVGQVAGVDVEPPRSSVTDPGTTVLFPHTLQNIGNGTDSFTVAAQSAQGWPVRVYLDVNGNGVLDPGELPVSGPIPLAAGATASLLLAVDVPGVASVRGMVDTLALTGTSQVNPAVSDAVTDLLQVRDVGIVVALAKAVDRPTAVAGDILTYTIGYQATGPDSATSLVLSDPIPAGAVYVPGTIRLNGVPQTDATGDDAGSYQAGSSQVVITLPSLASGASGSVTFQAQALAPTAPPAPQVVTNVAGATYLTIAGSDSVTSNAVQTTVAAPTVTLAKTLVSAAIANVGEQVQYQLAWGNPSPTATVLGAVLTDTLPTGLDYVSSVPAATAAGNVLQWSLGDLPAGSSGQIQLTTVVSPAVVDTQRVTNTAWLTSVNAAAQAASAAEVTLVGSSASALTLTKTADVVEVSLGETAPFTLVVGNAGTAPLTGIVIHDYLPEGTRYARGTATGVDSAVARGRNLTFYIAGPLAPGADRTVHYAVAVVSAPSTTLENIAYATAGGLLRSADAVAALQVNGSWAMQDRAVIGKVWIDANDNGVQDAGEVGMPGVDVWTEDGDIATTDAEGRFSFRNILPGTEHAYHVDRATVPAGYQLADSALHRPLVTRFSTGWTTPRVDFRLVPRAARVAGVRLPLGWNVTVQPLDTPGDTLRIERPAAAPRPVEQPPVTVRAVHFESNWYGLSPAAVSVLDSLVPWFEANPEVLIVIRGHTDSLGTLAHNGRLSRARARSVMKHLAHAGIDSARFEPEGFGPAMPVASNATAAGRALNRRAELRIEQVEPAGAVAEPAESLVVTPPQRRVAFDVAIRNPYPIPVSGLGLAYPEALDSVKVFLDDSLVTRSDIALVALPTLPPQSRLRILGWGPRAGDSLAVGLLLDGRPLGRAAAALGDSVVRIAAVTGPAVTSDSLPDLAVLPAGGEVAVSLGAPATGWRRQADYALPSGWRVASDTGAAGAVTAAPAQGGVEVLTWKLDTPPSGDLEVRLRPATALAPAEPARIAALRTPESRTAEKQGAFLSGPGVEIFNPTDGSVLRSDKVYVGVRGEANAPITLFNGDSVLADTRLRPDGVQDFIALPLAPGTHRLRVRMRNSWSQDRWDSVAVHVTGAPASFEADKSTLALAADGQTLQAARVRVLDGWGVPVVNQPRVTVEAEGAEPVNPDGDASSVGLQVVADDAGWLTIWLRPGITVGRGTLRLAYGTLHAEFGLDIYPAAQPLLFTGVGMVGIGATPYAFGAATARGSLDDRTSFLVSVDTRRLDAGRDAFGRAADPLEEAQYPILGDASSYRTLSASTYEVSARVERGYDWIAFGDLSLNGGLTSELGLSTYRRALPGLAAQVATGPVTWQGFGSSTSQLLRQTQIRGAGISGPYEFGGTIRYGTEQVTVETRERNNAEHILSREVLTRFVDYQVNYETGTLLLKRPVPAADAYGNPVYLVVLYESETGGPSSEVWGIRATFDGAQVLRTGVLDSLRFGATWVHETPEAGGHQLLGADLRFVESRRLTLGGEVSFSTGPDSSGTATALDGSYTLLGGAAQLSGSWLGVSREFGNPSNPALQGGTSEVTLGGQYKQGPREFRVGYNWQRFDIQDLERRQLSASLLQPIGSQVQVLGTVTDERYQGPSLDDDLQAAEAKVTWTPQPRLSLWTEGRVELGGDGAMNRPDYAGIGAGYAVTDAVSLEVRHRRAFLPADSGSYSVTDLGVRSRIGLGTEAYGSYQIAGVSGASNAALVGLRNRLPLGQDWLVNALFERRVGLDKAANLDPVRALPFLQQEESYWSFGLGAEYLPVRRPYRLSARTEFKDGDVNSNFLVTFAGDVSITPSLALLNREDWIETEQDNGIQVLEGHRYGSLWGLAFRPIRDNRLNVLAKYEWINVLNPRAGSVLGGTGEEGRTILATEAIYEPSAASEIAARFALRRSTTTLTYADGTTQELESDARFVGLRGSLLVHPLVEARLDGRLLMERTSDTERYMLAPQLAFLPQRTLEVVGGYRFGDLRDPDFANDGGEGWFVTFSARVSEQTFSSAAEFWRQRFGGK